MNGVYRITEPPKDVATGGYLKKEQFILTQRLKSDLGIILLNIL